jgi:hypothetical protein
MRCTIAGQSFYLQASEVETAMSRVEPEPVSGACVQVGRRWFPMLQVGAVLTGQDRRDITTAEISKALIRLGLDCRTTPPPVEA